MAKRTYRAVPIQRVAKERLEDAVGTVKGIVSVDLAKRKIVASFAAADGQVSRIIRFDHPRQTMDFVGRVRELARDRPIEVVMESTGTYGDPIRYQLAKAGVPIFSISPKRVHDAAEVFDGVPSLHDAKACVVMSQLHAQGATRAFQAPGLERRELRALIKQRAIFDEPFHQHVGRIEAILARHWPRGLEVLDIWHAKSALSLLEAMPGPDAIAAQPDEARALLRRVSRGNLSPERIEEILEASTRSMGAPMTEQEKRTLELLAAEALRLRSRMAELDGPIDEKLQSCPAANAIAGVVGRVTAVALIAFLGDFRDYDCAGRLEKAAGLNLKIRSSAETKKGRLAITKRGPSAVRRYLFFAALRLIKKDAVLAAWYRARGGYKANYKLIAVVAVMRKLIRALWYVARGDAFDSRKLVDARKLGLPSPDCTSASP